MASRLARAMSLFESQWVQFEEAYIKAPPLVAELCLWVWIWLGAWGFRCLIGTLRLKPGVSSFVGRT